jgi:hypothetical protein
MVMKTQRMFRAAARYALHEQKKEILSEINMEMGPHNTLIDIV